jgi:tetratricopeptide (TPR) repeat protein
MHRSVEIGQPINSKQCSETADGVAREEVLSESRMRELAELFVGRAEETEGHILEALRLSPRDTSAFAWAQFAGSAKLLLGADEMAVGWYRRSIESNGNYSLSHFHLATALTQLGRLDEARAEVQVGLALDPKFTLRRFRSGPASDNPTFLAQRERIYDGMRNAGVPEG